ncbi:DUF1045 domain-containing protein [Phyllobacterium chamaecytisi]|uniref:DUF1045 domain-containing protein n=1 Tax=Phyllobacterium chamaecytisi TaxID=2876082 RepID=UPI001CCDE849|nr:DUF1045 domain-containing protein [Phyllobacterium sp. KW56]
MPGAPSPRYAIYYTPGRNHPLTKAAFEWLGRDAFDKSTNPSALKAYTEPVSEPYRYGFHATLKAPFRLASDCSLVALEDALRTFAAVCPSCPIGPLRIGLIDGFFALVPAFPSPALRGFASRVVQEFDRFRAPMNEAELQRRMDRSLDEIEINNLVCWGYPYVLDRFRFHLTLSDRLSAALQPKTRERLTAIFKTHLDEDYRLNTLSLFVQDNPTSVFYVRLTFPLRGPQLSVQRVHGKAL